MSRRSAALLVTGLALALSAVALPAAALTQDREVDHIVIYPGSHEVRYVDVTNTARGAGIMTVSIVNAVADHDDLRDDVFFDEMLINGFRASDLEGAKTVIHTQYTERGQTITLPIEVTFPRDATGGNAAVSGDHLFAFDLRVTVQGPRDAVSPTPTRSTTPGTATGPTTTTGGTVRGADWRLLAGAAGLATLGALIARAGRSSRRDTTA